ncbi:hypothetical protein [Stratiformator vulcanicus]|uniref:Uncharacterized protein n=1 Tax=Stratiformator vulcanicus TaxID=2527980 RepID=A0A517R175_9PLAN|nr:hypothetical protein [Stratiformator vulcanicus]QDT37584.1 hypothetical protein Pan189_19640 [Stratiformator vulcanicus]
MPTYFNGLGCLVAFAAAIFGLSQQCQAGEAYFPVAPRVASAETAGQPNSAIETSSRYEASLKPSAGSEAEAGQKRETVEIDDSPAVLTFEELLKPIGSIGATAGQNALELPEDRFQSRSPLLMPAERERVSLMYQWAPSGLYHEPLYFRDVSLERYGWSYGPVLQPIASGLRFGYDAALLPYQIGVDLPWDRQYQLGLGRPGSYNPPVRKHLPLSARGALLEAGTVVGGVAFFR